MGSDPSVYRSHLFTVRLWQEKLEEGQTEWRGQMQSVGDGERRYFRDWPALNAFLEEKLQELEELNGDAPS